MWSASVIRTALIIFMLSVSVAHGEEAGGSGGATHNTGGEGGEAKAEGEEDKAKADADAAKAEQEAAQAEQAQTAETINGLIAENSPDAKEAIENFLKDLKASLNKAAKEGNVDEANRLAELVDDFQNKLGAVIEGAVAAAAPKPQQGTNPSSNAITVEKVGPTAPAEGGSGTTPAAEAPPAQVAHGGGAPSQSGGTGGSGGGSVTPKRTAKSGGGGNSRIPNSVSSLSSARREIDSFKPPEQNNESARPGGVASGFNGGQSVANIASAPSALSKTFPGTGVTPSEPAAPKREVASTTPARVGASAAPATPAAATLAFNAGSTAPTLADGVVARVPQSVPQEATGKPSAPATLLAAAISTPVSSARGASTNPIGSAANIYPRAAAPASAPKNAGATSGENFYAKSVADNSSSYVLRDKPISRQGPSGYITMMPSSESSRAAAAAEEIRMPTAGPVAQELNTRGALSLNTAPSEKPDPALKTAADTNNYNSPDQYTIKAKEPVLPKTDSLLVASLIKMPRTLPVLPPPLVVRGVASLPGKKKPIPKGASDLKSLALDTELALSRLSN